MKKILVVDDDEDIRNLVVSLLKMKGFKSFGLADLNPSQLTDIPDLIILDYLLEGKSGIDICKALQQQNETRYTPVIMISAMNDAKEKCLAAGAEEFMSKPFNVKDLVACVNKVLSAGEVGQG
jgi:two-component system phosphate regulon response regulator PhoB